MYRPLCSSLRKPSVHNGTVRECRIDENNYFLFLRSYQSLLLCNITLWFVSNSFFEDKIVFFDRYSLVADFRGSLFIFSAVKTKSVKGTSSCHLYNLNSKIDED